MKIKNIFISILPIFICIIAIFICFIFVFNNEPDSLSNYSDTPSSLVYPTPDNAQRIELLYNCHTSKSDYVSIDPTNDYATEQEVISAAEKIVDEILLSYNEAYDVSLAVPKEVNIGYIKGEQSVPTAKPTVTPIEKEVLKQYSIHFNKIVNKTQGGGSTAVYTIDVSISNHNIHSILIKLDAETLLPYSINAYFGVSSEHLSYLDILPQAITNAWGGLNATADGEITALIYEYYHLNNETLPYLEGTYYIHGIPNVKCLRVTIDDEQCYVIRYYNSKYGEETAFIMTKNILDKILA